MQDLERKQSLAKEKAVLKKRVITQGEILDVDEDPLEECERLASTAGTVIKSGIVQRRQAMHAATAFGKGKVEELAILVKNHEADVVIFDNDLSPAQTRNLEQAVKAKVIDRTELILDIFASNAQTLESRLAVELAQLEYSLPRLKRMWTHLDRVKMGGCAVPGRNS